MKDQRTVLAALGTTLLVALVGIFTATAAGAASPTVHAQTRVAAIGHASGQPVSPSETVLPGGSRPRAPSYDRHATGSSVAAEGEGVLNLSAEDSWGNPSTLEDHFLRHGADFGATSSEEYAADASEFLQQALQDGYPAKVDADGVIRVYDPETNTFGSYNANGTTRTFFKPTTGAAYWATQPGSAP